jgi:hypothetical protein
MSTKTTFKRIALVAVAALGFGLLSAAPSSASNATAVAMSPVVLTTSPTVGETVTILTNHSGFFTGTGANASYQNISVTWSGVPLTSTTTAQPVIRGVVANDNTYGQLASYRIPAGGYIEDTTTGGSNNQIAAIKASGANTGSGVFNVWTTTTFVPDVAGTYVVNIQDAARASYYNKDVTIVVGARAGITAFGATTSTTASTAVGAAVGLGFGSETAGFSAAKTATGNAVLAITTTQRNGVAAGGLVMTSFNKLTATISGPGLIAWDEAGQVPSRASTMGTAAQTRILNVYGDGTAGVGTITFSSGTTVLGTKKITFYSTTVAKITTVVNHGIIVSGPNAADALGYGAVTATVVDADGFPIANTTVVATSSAPSSVALTSASATTDSYGEATFLVTGGAVVGSALITVATGTIATATGYVAAAPVSVRRGTATVAKYALSLDKSDYLPGELATMTVLLTDSLGLPVADGGTLTTTSVTSSFALAGGTLPTTSIVAAAGDLGKYSVKFNMPVNPGQQTFTVTLPATSTVTGNGSVTVTVSPDATSQAAADAAAEATDAANAATDAANAAAEAADAATAAAQDASDAVAALSTQVTTMIDALKKQITALTNLVIKIQKKVKA